MHDANHLISAQLDNGPVAEVQRIGRWAYSITIRDGLGRDVGDWTVLGRRRAHRFAARELARYLRQKQRSADITVMFPDGSTLASCPAGDGSPCATCRALANSGHIRPQGPA